MPDASALARILQIIRPGTTLSRASARQLAVDLRQLASLADQYEEPDARPVAPPASAKEQCLPKRQKKQFDFDKHSYRYVALRLLYVGWTYHGFASQANEPNTIEAHLFKALKLTRLVRPDATTHDIHYTRCGRTDIGVSALGQVITLEVRSKVAADEELPPPEQELDYPFVLNKVLPTDIQITGWAAVDRSFHARFSARSREYKYFFAGAPSQLRNSSFMERSATHLAIVADIEYLFTFSTIQDVFLSALTTSCCHALQHGPG
jgi:tRNA pseudouridine38/39 synthase